MSLVLEKLKIYVCSFLVDLNLSDFKSLTLVVDKSIQTTYNISLTLETKLW